MAAQTTRPPPMPGPWGLPGVGPMINAVGVVRDPMVTMQRLYQRYGPLVTLARGTRRTIFVFSPELNRQVLGSADGFNTLNASSLPLPVPKDSALERAWNNGLLQ